MSAPNPFKTINGAARPPRNTAERLAALDKMNTGEWEQVIAMPGAEKSVRQKAQALLDEFNDYCRRNPL
ncbi:hypothetical protein V2T44_24055 [Serratia ficaria]|uniref:hypothetical protein n=1 Tax=Enterobacterales TaxID=91347 RepID=UPI002ED1C477|nr:hypothetical protein [Enterobacter mori]MEE4486008.1 hypothetical protein [Serratia ficaria]